MRTTMWSNVYVWSTQKPKLNYRELSDQVQYVVKTRKDNNLTDYIGTLCIENDTEFSWLIELSAV